jgi:hypothetical protein
MPETVDVLLWSAAIATWLMMFFAIVNDSVKKLLLFVRGRKNALQRAPSDRHPNAGR